MKRFITQIVCLTFATILCAWNVNAQNYNVVLTSNPATGGIVNTLGVYEHGMEVAIVAIPSINYKFLNWTNEEGDLISSDTKYVFTVTKDLQLVANFGLSTPPLEISVSANPKEYGTVSGGGIYTFEEQVLVSAIAQNGYQFKNWTEDGVIVADTPSGDYTFIASDNRALVANFAPAVYGVAIVTNPYKGGTVFGDGLFIHGKEVIVSAVASPGYVFVNWTEYGREVSPTPEYAFRAQEPRSLYANFKKLEEIEK